MREFGFKKCFVWLVAVIAIGICSFIVVREKESVQRDRDVDRSCLMMPDKVAIGTDRQRYVPPSEGEMREYERIVCEIVSAYSNQQAKLILECVKKLPDRFFELRGNDWNQAILPMNRAWFDGWSIGEPTMTFKTSEDLRTWLQANLTFAKAYGTMLSKAGKMDMLPAFDIWILTGLQAHKEKYVKACKRDYLDVTERFIAAWVEQIESESGFTREYMRWQNRSLGRLVKEGELTPAKLRRNIRCNAWPLQKRCGYTPKWLDVEFPVLEEKAGTMKE